MGLASSLALALILAARAQTANEEMVYRQPRTSAAMLWDLRADATGNRRIEVDFYLGRSLENLDILHSAWRRYREVVAAGPSERWAPALQRVVEIGALMGDERESLALARAIDPALYPPKVAADLHYLRGAALQAEGRDEEALAALLAVPAGSPRSPAALLRAGVAQHRLGSREAAWGTLVDLYRRKPVGSKLEKHAMRGVQELALLDLARVAYAAHDFALARRIYAAIPDTSPHRSQALLESAWASWWLDHVSADAEAAGAALRGFAPEAETLQLLLLAERGVPVADACAALRARYEPIEAELAALAQMDPAAAWDRYLGEGEDVPSVLPPSAFTRLFRDQRLAGAIYHLRRIERDRLSIRQQPTGWQIEVGDALLAELAADERQLQIDAGALLTLGAAGLGREVKAALLAADLLAEPGAPRSLDR